MANYANKGRRGDTKIREVDNEPAHVNAFESYLIDNYGALGEDIVESVGSGTINPKTGLKEYSRLSDATGIHIGWRSGQRGFDAYIGDDNEDWWTGEESVIGHVFPMHGSGWFTKGKTDEYRLERQAKGVAKEGIRDLQEQAERKLGPGGAIEQEYGIKREEVGLQREGLMATGRQTIGNILDQGQELAGKTGMAYSGTAERAMTKGLETVESETSRGLDAIKLSLDRLRFEEGEREFDVLASLKKGKTDILMDYMTAIGDAYSGGGAASDFDRWIEEYKENM